MPSPSWKAVISTTTWPIRPSRRPPYVVYVAYMLPAVLGY